MILILKKELINFCKLYDNEGTTKLPLRSDHFISPTVWHLVFGLNFITSILLMISFHKGKTVTVPCDTRKHLDTSFGMNKFSKKEPINFCKYYLVRGSFNSTKCVLITLLRKNWCRPVEMTNWKKSQFRTLLSLRPEIWSERKIKHKQSFAPYILGL